MDPRQSVSWYNLGQDVIQLGVLHLAEQFHIFPESFLRLLVPLPEVGRQLKAVDEASAVPGYDQGFGGVEGELVENSLVAVQYFLNSGEVSLTPDLACPHLVADGAVFVDEEVEDHHPPVQRGGREDGAGVRGPGHVPHLRPQVVPQQGLREVFVPDVDGVLRGAGEEDAGVESVPDDGVDGGSVSRVLHQERRGELRGGQIDIALVCSNQENILIVRLECDGSRSLHQVFSQVLSISERFGVGQDQLVVEPQRGLHDGPVGHSAVSADAEEVEVAVQVVPHPLDLPDHVSVFASQGRGGECGLAGASFQVVDSNISIVETNNHHVGVTRVNVKGNHPGAGLTHVPDHHSSLYKC